MKYKFVIINNIVVLFLSIIAITATLLDWTDIFGPFISFPILVMIWWGPRYIYKSLFKKEIYVGKGNAFTQICVIIMGALINILVILTGNFYLPSIYIAGYIVLETIVCLILLLKENAEKESNII